MADDKDEGWGCGCLVMVLIVVGVFYLFGAFDNWLKPKPPPPPPPKNNTVNTIIETATWGVVAALAGKALVDDVEYNRRRAEREQSRPVFINYNNNTHNSYHSHKTTNYSSSTYNGYFY